MIDDFGVFFTNKSVIRYNENEKDFQQFLELIGDENKVIISGHSLGGTVAE